MQNKEKSFVTLEQTLGSLVSMTISDLQKCFLKLNPGMENAGFIRDFIAPYIDSDVDTCDNLLGEMLTQYTKAQENGASVDLKNGLLLISTVYCLQAGKQLNLDNREYAWAYMVQAKYWHGVVTASLGIVAARAATIAVTNKAAREKGAFVRKGNYEKVTQEAYRLVREKVANGELWRSQARAASEIKDRVLKFGKDVQRPLAELSAEDRIKEWLGKMPDKAAFFKTTPKKSKKSSL